jgi:transcriptional regulator with XRE-family HTH domain
MNDLQRLFKARRLSMRELAARIGQDMHSVQKVVKGTRQTPHIKQAVAVFLGLSVDGCFGPQSALILRKLTNQELQKLRIDFESKLQTIFFDNPRISGRRKVVNG